MTIYNVSWTVNACPHYFSFFLCLRREDEFCDSVDNLLLSSELYQKVSPHSPLPISPLFLRKTRSFGQNSKSTILLHRLLVLQTCVVNIFKQHKCVIQQ